MKNLNHPNVMELIGICWSDDPTNERHVSPYIVLPFMDLGDLKTFLRKRRPNRRTEVPDNPSKVVVWVSLGDSESNCGYLGAY